MPPLTIWALETTNGLNHFRQLQKKLAVAKIQHELPVLQRRFAANPESFHHAKSTVEIQRHQISIWIDKAFDTQIVEGAPQRRFTGTDSGGYLWWVIGGLVLLALYFF